MIRSDGSCGRHGMETFMLRVCPALSGVGVAIDDEDAGDAARTKRIVGLNLFSRQRRQIFSPYINTDMTKDRTQSFRFL